MTSSDIDVKKVIKYLIECRREGNAVYHGEDLVAGQISSLNDVPVGVLGPGVPVLGTFKAYYEQHLESNDEFVMLCRFLLLPIFEFLPFPIGRELAYIYGRLERMKIAGMTGSFAEKLSDWTRTFENKDLVAASKFEILDRNLRAINDDLFGKSVAQVCEESFSVNNLPKIENIINPAFCVLLESRFMLALCESIVSADESIDSTQKEDVKACLKLMSGQALQDFVDRIAGKPPKSFVENLIRDIGSCMKPTAEVEHQVKVLVQAIRMHYIGDFEVEDIKLGESYLLPSDADNAAFGTLYAQALALRLIGSSFSEGIDELVTRLKNLALSTKAKALINASKGTRWQIFVTTVKPLLQNCLASKGFEGLLKQPHGQPFVVHMLHRLILRNIDLYNGGDFYSPYLAICNSAGTGKTKLAMELAAQSVSLYLCLRSRDSSGEPGRSMIADYFLSRNRFNDINSISCFMFAILDTWIELVPQWIKAMPQIRADYYSLFQDAPRPTTLKIIGDLIAVKYLYVNGRHYHEDFWKIVESKCRDQFSDTTWVRANAHKVDITDIQQQLLLHFSHRIEAINEILRKDLHYCEEELPAIPVVFIFDDARSLLSDHEMNPNDAPVEQPSKFCLIRKFIRCFKSCKGFVVFLDSLARISNVPIAVRDSSRAPQLLKLFNPVIQIPLFEVVKVKNKGDLESIPSISTAYASLTYRWSEELEMSRGLFPTMYDLLSTGLNSREKWFEVLLEAGNRFCAPSKTLLGPNEVGSMVLAVIAAKFGIPYVSNIISTDLMSSRMALGLRLISDREFLQAGYMGEPVISEVVTRLMYTGFIKTRDVSLPNCLAVLRDKVLSGYCLISDIGSVGRLVMAVYLSLAKDSVILRHLLDYPSLVRELPKDARLCDPCAVGHFLDRLCANKKGLQSVQSGNELLMNSFVSFASFVPLEPQSVRNSLFKKFAEQFPEEWKRRSFDNELPLINRSLLLKGWKSRTAYYAPPDTDVVDIIIPVAVGRKRNENPLAKDFDGSTSFEVTENDMSAIVVQVTNRKGRVHQNQCKQSLSFIHPPRKSLFEGGLNPILVILCNVGSGGLDDAGAIEISRRTLGQSPPSASDYAPTVLYLDSNQIQDALQMDEYIRQTLDQLATIGTGLYEAIIRTYQLDRDDPSSANQALYYASRMCHDTPLVVDLEVDQSVGHANTEEGKSDPMATESEI